MKDLSAGSIPGHIVSMSIQMAIGILVQTLYFFTDLYFVAKIGDAAIAGLNTAGTLWFVVLAITQVLSVGTVAMVSHAVGAQQRDRANLVFNQSLTMSLVIGAFVFIGINLAAGPYMLSVAADEATARAGVDYLRWYAPGLGLQFVTIAMFSTLRATGIVLPTMILQVISVLVNVALAPVLIAGWGTGYAMGTAGAGLASTIATLVGLVLSAWYFHRHEKYVAIHREQMRVRWPVWGGLLFIGMPVGLEFLLMSLSMFVIWILVRDFGSAAQAGIGTGMTVMRIIMLPAMAVAFAAAPIAGQNFGARRPERVRETFRYTVIYSAGIMLLLTVLCQFASHAFMEVFTPEKAVVEVGAEMLLITSWNFVANGFVFSCSSMFQAMGNTWPTVISSAVRLVLFVVPAIWVASRPGFQLYEMWLVSVATMFVQAAVSYAFVRREFARRLAPLSMVSPRVAA